MTIEYKKALKSIACLAVCLFGIEKASFSTELEYSPENETIAEDSVPESKSKKGFLGRTASRAKKVKDSVKSKAEDIMDAAQCAVRCRSEKACKDNPSLAAKCADECPEFPCGSNEAARFTGRLKKGVSGLSSKAGKVDIGLNRETMSCDDLKQRIYELMMEGIIAKKGALSIKEQKYILGNKCPYESMNDWVKKTPEKVLPFKNKIKKLMKDKWSAERVDKFIEQMHATFPEALARQNADLKEAKKSMVSDAFKTMDIPETATQGEVKKQYYKMARTMHPDKGGDEEAFKKLGKAYEILELYFENLPEER